MSNPDPDLRKQVEKLHELTVYGRWLFVIFCWLSFGVIGIWGLRNEISLWLEYFTWSALLYSLVYNTYSALSVIFCIAVTSSVLVWQTVNIIRGGISHSERQRLERWVKKIRAKGPKHPLWSMVCK